MTAASYTTSRDTTGSFVRIPGSIVDSVGSITAGCCGIRDIAGRMSRRMRHYES
jgi:hypothetical protein